MAFRDSLLIEISLEQDVDLSAGEFISLFRWLDTLSKAVVNSELSSFLNREIADSSARREAEYILEPLRTLLPPPVEILSVSRESPWVILGHLSVDAVFIYVLKQLAPTLGKAFSISRLNEHLKLYLRDHLFMGAAEAATKKAHRVKRYGNTRVKEITSSVDHYRGQPKLTVKIQRSEIIEISSSDDAAIAEMAKQLMNRRE